MNEEQERQREDVRRRSCFLRVHLAAHIPMGIGNIGDFLGRCFKLTGKAAACYHAFENEKRNRKNGK